MTSERAIIIKFEAVNYEIDGLKILNNIDLEIPSGQTVVILGESGCGKTTTLKLINRLIEPTSGRILLRGIPTTEWDPIELRRSVGYVMQDGGLFPHMTVRQNAGIVLTLQGGETKSRSADEMLELVELDPGKFGDRFPHELSGGQRQRVGVARALAADPDLLLLDEPFGALDAITRAGLQKEFAELVGRLDKTAVFVTHDLHEAMLLGTRIVLMENGRIVFDNVPEAFRKSELPLAKAYLDTVLLSG